MTLEAKISPPLKHTAVASSVWRVSWLVFILVAQRAVSCWIFGCCQVLPRVPSAAMASARSRYPTYCAERGKEFSYKSLDWL